MKISPPGIRVTGAPVSRLRNWPPSVSCSSCTTCGTPAGWIGRRPEAVRCRIDFKYALGLELDDPGFHHSVLGDFRDRLAREGRADALLTLALERLKAAGLVRERGRQRTDSTRI